MFKRWLSNLAVLAGSLLATLLVLEFVVFAYILVPDDVLHNVTIDGVVRYEPNAKATFRHPDGSRTTSTINADGWNSTKSSYDVPPDPNRLRVAVIGDSYVHGAFIDTADGFPELIEQRLTAAGTPADVLRFGMDGAPLTQYLQMLRREVVKYHPDLVVVQLIHNDFDESYRFMGTRYNSSFLKLAISDAGDVTEVPPQDFKPGWPDLMRELRTFRYLYYETNAYLKLKNLVSKFVWGETELFSPEFISSAVDIRNITDHTRIRIATRYVMSEIGKLADAHDFKVLFVIDGVREAIYAGKDRSVYEVSILNRIATETAGELGLPLLDLQDALAADYARHKQRLEFDFDWHWNKRGNSVVADAIVAYLRAHPGLLGSRPQLKAEGVAATIE